MKALRFILSAAALAAVLVSGAARADTFGTAIGGGVGAVAGALIGDSVGGRHGAIVGSGVGGAVGAVVGQRLSQQERGYVVHDYGYPPPRRVEYHYYDYPRHPGHGHAWGHYKQHRKHYKKHHHHHDHD